MKKIFIPFISVIMAMAMFTACGSDNGSEADESSSDTSAQESSSDTESTSESSSSVSDTAPKSLSSALDGTLWAGTDYRSDRYAVGFSGNRAYFSDNESSVTEGYWAVNDDTLRIYRDEANTEKLCEIPLSYDTEKNTLILNSSALMVQSEDASPDNVQEAVKELSAAAKAAKCLEDSYWAAYNNSAATAVHISDVSMEMITVRYDGSADTADYIWSIDGSSIYLYDDNYDLKLIYGWQLSDDGTALTLTDDDTTLDCSPLTEEQSKDIVNCLLDIIKDNT